MADNRKEQDRAELHRKIWKIADDLRGSVDGWDFKRLQYINNMQYNKKSLKISGLTSLLNHFKQVHLVTN